MGGARRGKAGLGAARRGKAGAELPGWARVVRVR